MYYEHTMHYSSKVRILLSILLFLKKAKPTNNASIDSKSSWCKYSFAVVSCAMLFFRGQIWKELIGKSNYTNYVLLINENYK